MVQTSVLKGRFMGDPSHEYEHTELQKMSEGEKVFEEEVVVSEDESGRTERAWAIQSPAQWKLWCQHHKPTQLPCDRVESRRAAPSAPSGAGLWAGAGRGGSVLRFQVMGCAQALVSLYQSLSYWIIYPQDSQCEGTKRNLAKWLSHPCLPVPQVFFPRDINVTHFAPVCMSTCCYAKRSLDQKHHHGLGVRNAHSQAGIRIGILTHSKGI